MRLTEGGWNLDEEHFQIGRRLMQENGLTQGFRSEDDPFDVEERLCEKCYALGQAATAALSDDEVSALFLKSDWDSLQGEGVHTAEARMTLMRQIVSSNITDAMLQLLSVK